jgi:hypothetical protein
MPGRRFTVEQIVAKLREAERLQGQGQTVPPVSNRPQVSEQSFYRWRTNDRGVEGGRGAALEGVLS